MTSASFIDVTEVKNFCRDSIAALSSLQALIRFDRKFSVRNYASLFEWKVTNACPKDADHEMRARYREQILDAHANDSCMNYLCKYATQCMNMQHSTHVIDSFLVPIMIRDPDRKYDSRRIGARGQNTAECGGENGALAPPPPAAVAAKCCFSKTDPVNTVFIPIHSSDNIHWSLLVLYRIQKGKCAWFGVYYDTAGNINKHIAESFYDVFQKIVPRDIDSEVVFCENLVCAVNVYQQQDSWSCGYRSAALVKLICRMCSAIELEGGGNENEEGSGGGGGGGGGDYQSPSIRLADYMRENNCAEADLGDEGCARFLADAIDAARSFELVQCVRDRVQNI